jgi:hypothetical protein
MPRLPGDSPLVYPDNTGEYVPSEFRRVQDTCSTCVGNDDETVKEVIERYVVGKHGVPELSNTICDSCVTDEIGTTLSMLKVRISALEEAEVDPMLTNHYASVIADLQREYNKAFAKRHGG